MQHLIYFLAGIGALAVILALWVWVLCWMNNKDEDDFFDPKL